MMSTGRIGQTHDEIDGPPLGTIHKEASEFVLGLPNSGGVGAASGPSSGSRRGKRGGEMGAPPSFLDKLCEILDDEQLSEHITWNKGGDGIVIGKVERFAAEVLPKYYKHSNYQSFVRQLNIYGFHKTRHDETSCEFKNPHFKRGQRHLLSLIRRKSQSSNTAKQRDENAYAEAKGIFDHVTAELRRLCNRMSALEAEMGMVNHRYDTLLQESKALWDTVLKGDERLRQKAISAVRQLSLSSSELNVCHQPAVENEAEQHSSPPSSVPRAVHQRQTPVTWRSSSSLRSSPSSSQLAGAQRQVSHPQPRSPFAHQGCLGQPVMVSGAGMGSCALRPSDATDKANHAPMRGAHPNSNAYHSLPPLTADQLASDSLLSLAGMPPPSSPLPVASSSGASASVEEEDEEDGGARLIRRRTDVQLSQMQTDTWPSNSMHLPVSVASSVDARPSARVVDLHSKQEGTPSASDRCQQADSIAGKNSSTGGSMLTSAALEARCGAVDNASADVDRLRATGLGTHGRAARGSMPGVGSAERADYRTTGGRDGGGRLTMNAMVTSEPVLLDEMLPMRPLSSRRRPMGSSSPPSPLPNATVARGAGASGSQGGGNSDHDISTARRLELPAERRDIGIIPTGDVARRRSVVLVEQSAVAEVGDRPGKGVRDNREIGRVDNGRGGDAKEDNYKRPLEKEQVEELESGVGSRRRRTTSS